MTGNESQLNQSDTVRTINEALLNAINDGVIWHKATGSEYQGRFIEVGNNRLLNFGGCSYLGLEQNTQLKKGVIDTTQRYGTQFSISRTYLESPLYTTLETLLEEVTGGNVLVTPSTTFAHMTAMPVLVRPGDAIVLDRSAHASLHMAIKLVEGVDVIAIKHSRIDMVEEVASKLAAGHERVWYVIDGLYSMFGDFAPLREITDVMRRVPQLFLYVDDAHSTSWYGSHGRGYALEKLIDRSRVVVTLSLNKAFSAAGGALVLPNRETRDQVLRCGWPMLFSGPIQSPMLGAAIASAKLHLEDSFYSLQKELSERIQRIYAFADELNISFTNRDPTPIFFIHCGSVDATHAVFLDLYKNGLFVCPSAFPIVAKGKAGNRFTVSLNNTWEDIETLMNALAEATARHGVQ